MVEFEHSEDSLQNEREIRAFAKELADEPLTPWVTSWKDFMERFNWVSASVLLTTPFIALYGLLFVPITFNTAIATLFYYFFTGFGITAGYHRLFSHRSYTASTPVRVALMIMGAGCMEGSVRWWCRNHRLHHRFTDTNLDPYNAKQGFFYAHFGWMLLKQDVSRVPKGAFDISDLDADPWVMWQHRNYVPLSLLFGFILPTVIPGLFWGDWAGGFFFVTILRLVVVHHATFCVNSVAHWLGDQPFADKLTPRDHVITALLTMGEGYHNFHHEFPQDYRNAIRWYQYDPTKWLIRFLHLFGLVSDLKRFPQNEISKGQVQMKQKWLDKEIARYDWGPDPEKLPILSRQQFLRMKKEGKAVMIVDGFVHDVSEFLDEHPGGAIIKKYIGLDASDAFGGVVYEHSNTARRILNTYRIGRIEPTSSLGKLKSPEATA